MRARAVAWAAVAVTVVCVVADTVFTALHSPLLSEETWAIHGWPLATLATLGCSLMGALVVSRYPRHPIGWLLLVAGTASISLATEAYGLWATEDAGAAWEHSGRVAGWVSVLFNAPLALTAISLIFLIAPDGHLASRRWRWAAIASVTGLASYTASILTVSPGAFEFGDGVEVSAITGTLSSAGIVIVAGALVASAVSLSLRLRRGRDETRRQLLWIAAAASALAVGFVWLLAVQIVRGGEQTFLAAIPLFAAYLAFPVAVAVAVLRHRLFDIDLIVNRALVVALAAALVAVGYVSVVVVVGAAVGGGTGGFWPSLLATALVAMAFQPLRRRVVRVADRLAFGAAAAPYEALADFSRRLGDSPDPAALLPAVAEAAAGAVSARRTVVRLSLPGAADRVATWPSRTAQPDHDQVADGAGVELPVADRGEPLGTLRVVMPAGRNLRPREQRLLQDLADQAGLAFRNARLSAELAAGVDELTRSTVELAESRRRLITAGDVERSRLERSIARAVVPHLEPMPALLDELGGTGGAGLTTEPLEALVAESTAALEALREITRGIFPAQLARSGLPAALGAHLGRTGGVLEVHGAAADRRFDPRVEAAVYFCAVEASRDLGPPVRVTLTASDGLLVLLVGGEDRGDLPVGSWRDRVEAVGGTITIRGEGPGQTLAVSVPVEPAQGLAEGRPAEAHTASRRSGPNADLVT